MPAARAMANFGLSELRIVKPREDFPNARARAAASGADRVLDAAAVKIVEMSAPFAAFPPDIRRDTDILHITRTWTFTKGDELVSQ